METGIQFDEHVFLAHVIMGHLTCTALRLLRHYHR